MTRPTQWIEIVEADRLPGIPSPRWKRLVFQVGTHNTISNRSGSRYPFSRSSSIHAGAVYDLTDHVALPLAALRERGVGVGVKF